MLFFVSLLVDGALAGAVYALVALAFVVVYKASRVMNFALGEWVMLGARLVAAGLAVPGLGLAGALGAAAGGMMALGVAFSRLVLRPLAGHPPIALLMVTLGVGALMRGAAPLGFAGLPTAIALPLPPEPFVVHGVRAPVEKVAGALVALACVALAAWFFHRTRTGVALRAMSDDPQAAMAVGIDLDRHVSITWAMVGALAVLAGTLWTVVGGGGFGVALIGLKVFPIVIMGGLDSIPGALVGAMVVGVLESLTAGYVDPLVGGGFGTVACYLVLIAVLFVRPYGLFGRPAVERV